VLRVIVSGNRAGAGPSPIISQSEWRRQPGRGGNDGWKTSSQQKLIPFRI